MKILITGGCGFVGTNIILYLSEKNFNVSSLDNLSKKGSKFNLDLLKRKNIKNYKIDISNYKLIKKLPKFDLIIDCCAEPAVEVSKADFNRVINTNLIGTLNILKKCKKDKSKLIFLSSSRVYPINLIKDKIGFSNFNKNFSMDKKINERESLNGPKTLYGATKLSSELFIEEFSYAFNLKYIINRCSVISGPLQFGKEDQGFVSLWVWRHMLNKKLKYIGYGGNGNQVRDVLHADDLINLYLTAYKNKEKVKGQIFNIGGGIKNSLSILELLDFLAEQVEMPSLKFKHIKRRTSDQDFFVADIEKAKRILNWEPKVTYQKGIKKMLVWIKSCS